MTQDGYPYAVRANLHLAYVQMSSTEQKVWFGIDGPAEVPNIYYNRRYKNLADGLWYWQFSESVPVIVFDRIASTQASDVLYSPTSEFKNHTDGLYYKYLMHINHQLLCNPSVAGHMMVAFSNDGLCCTVPQYAYYADSVTPQVQCTIVGQGGPNAEPYDIEVTGIKVEMLTSMHDSADNKIHTIAIEGDLALLADAVAGLPKIPPLIA